MELKFEDIKIGDILIVICNAGFSMKAKVGDLVVVSDKSIEGDNWIYVEGNRNDSGFGQNANSFKKFEEVKQAKKLNTSLPMEDKRGTKFTLITDKGREQFPIVGYIGDSMAPACYRADGGFYTEGESGYDLVNSAIQLDGYINLYASGSTGERGNTVHESREKADMVAESHNRITGKVRIGVTKVTMKQGDDGK